MARDVDARRGRRGDLAEHSRPVGRFLQVDPIPGGNATAYDYCYHEPLNCTDLTGQASPMDLYAAAGASIGIALVASLSTPPGQKALRRVIYATGALGYEAYEGIRNRILEARNRRRAKNQKTRNKSIRSLEERIRDHLEKIRSERAKGSGADERLIDYWRREIEKFRREIDKLRRG